MKNFNEKGMKNQLLMVKKLNQLEETTTVKKNKNTYEIIKKKEVIKPSNCNEKIYDLLVNYINPYETFIEGTVGSNGALFQIFDSFFQNLRGKTLEVKKSGVILENIIKHNLPYTYFNISNDAYEKGGISFSFTFNKQKFFILFSKFLEGGEMFYNIQIKSNAETCYSVNFIFKYLLYNALEISNLKGSYINMPRDSFSWDIKTLGELTFDDIFLPTEITEDLHLFVDIFAKSGRILRYLKVGNPGVGKTESTIIIASELKKLGVTIIKTPICKELHNKVELANVLAPSLLIFDDIDLSLGDRNKGSYNQLLGDFLDVLDGTDKLSKDVGIIATTNAAHLLDLAAQRPGRFDKTLLFDDITKSNVKNIILKSLKNNFKDNSDEDLVLYTNEKIIKLFYDAGVSGAHVYNTISMLKLRYLTLGIVDITIKKIVDGINNELETIKKIRKTSYLKEKLDRNANSIGFGNNSDDCEYEDTEVEEINTPIRT